MNVVGALVVESTLSIGGDVDLPLCSAWSLVGVVLVLTDHRVVRELGSASEVVSVE